MSTNRIGTYLNSNGLNDSTTGRFWVNFQDIQGNYHHVELLQPQATIMDANTKEPWTILSVAASQCDGYLLPKWEDSTLITAKRQNGMKSISTFDWVKRVSYISILMSVLGIALQNPVFTVIGLILITVGITLLGSKLLGSRLR